jgi:hypothetical protein
VPFMRGPDGGGYLPPQPVGPDQLQPVTGQHKLKIEPSAIPDVIAAFEQALDEVRGKLREANYGIDQAAWAGDHVSQVTAQKFNERASTDANSAKAVLIGYQAQLQGVVENLKTMQESYQRTEGNNAALWKGQQV